MKNTHESAPRYGRPGWAAGRTPGGVGLEPAGLETQAVRPAACVLRTHLRRKAVRSTGYWLYT